MEQSHLWFPEAPPHFLHVWELVAQTASSPGSEAICSSPLAPAHLHQHPLGTAFLFFKSCLRPLFCWKWEGSRCRHHSSSSPPQAPLTTVLHTLGKGESINKAIPAPSNHFSSIFGMCQHQPPRLRDCWWTNGMRTGKVRIGNFSARIQLVPTSLPEKSGFRNT